MVPYLGDILGKLLPSLVQPTEHSFGRGFIRPVVASEGGRKGTAAARRRRPPEDIVCAELLVQLVQERRVVGLDHTAVDEQSSGRIPAERRRDGPVRNAFLMHKEMDS